MSISSKRMAPEIHKFGGASLADATAFRHAVAIVRGRDFGVDGVAPAPGWWSAPLPKG